MINSPEHIYYQQVKQGHIAEDPQQMMAIKHLNALSERLVNELKARSRSFAIFRKPKLVRGLYLWGGVGIGKTFLMDCFYQSLPFNKKLRMHFHAFMQYVQQELKANQGSKNPLSLVAKKIANNAIVLCFDEFFVKDIVDAMLLARLLEALYAEGVCLVATSNTQPDDLYKNGLQRISFLPAIRLINQHCLVVHLPSTIDYRLRHLREAGIYHMPDDDVSDKKLNEIFNYSAQHHEVDDLPITILGRDINVIKKSADIIWFHFDDICHVPRSQHDYLEIAKQYSIIMVSHVPQISANAHNRIELFIRFVDVLYDAKTRLILSAAVPVKEIYSEGRVVSEYARTCSRLLEMQSEDYFYRVSR